MAIRRVLGALLLIGLTLVAAVEISRGHIALGLDFEGGATLDYSLDSPDVDGPALARRVRTALADAGIHRADVHGAAGVLMLDIPDTANTDRAIEVLRSPGLGLEPTAVFRVESTLSASTIHAMIAVGAACFFLVFATAWKLHGLRGLALPIGALLTAFWAAAGFVALRGTLQLGSLGGSVLGVIVMVASLGIVFEAERRGGRRILAWLAAAALHVVAWSVTIALDRFGHGPARGFAIGEMASLPPALAVAVLGWAVAGEPVGAR